MTEYSNVINVADFTKNSCHSKQNIKLTVERTIENIWRRDQKNAYVRALSKPKGPL